MNSQTAAIIRKGSGCFEFVQTAESDAKQQHIRFSTFHNHIKSNRSEQQPLSERVVAALSLYKPLNQMRSSSTSDSALFTTTSRVTVLIGEL